jgi:predicted amidohydrolase
VWGIFSLTGEEHPEGKNPYNTLVMVSDKGTTDLVYRKVRGQALYCLRCAA